MFTNSTLRQFVPLLLLTAFWLVLVLFSLTTRSATDGLALAQESSHWRMTRFGWVDSRTWQRPDEGSARHRIELVHPVTFSALVALLSIALLIWASEEYDWGRMTSKRGLTIRQKLDRLQHHTGFDETRRE